MPLAYDDTMRWVLIPLAACLGVALVNVGGCSSFSAADDPAPDASADGGPIFADDFERNELLGMAWTSLSNLQGNNSVAIDTSQHVQGDRSLHAKVSAMKGIAFLERRDSYLGLTRVEISLRADALPDVGFIVAQLLYDNDTEVNLSLAQGGIKVAEQKMSDATHYAEASPSTFPLNEWVSIVWTIDRVAQHLQVSSPDHPSINVDYALTKTDLGTAVVAVRAGVVYEQDQKVSANVWLDDLKIYGASAH